VPATAILSAGAVALLSASTLLASVVPVSVAAAATSKPASGTSTALASSCGSDSFYRPPSRLPNRPAGSIIRSRVGCDYLAPGVAAPAKAWNVLYLSTDANDQPIAVSGTVLVPDSTWSGSGARPLVAYATGTQGWGNQCAPSREMAAGDYDENFAVQNLLDQGWAVAVTDYPGLGTTGKELYAVNLAEGYAVLDILKAAEQLKAAGLSQSSPVAIEGYSQGGGAAAFAAQEAATYAKSLDLVGVAMGGTPANLQAVADNLNGSAFFAFLGGAAIGFDNAYPQLHFSKYLNAAGKKALKELSTMCQEQGLVTFAFKKIQDYTKGGINPITLPPVEKVLDKNDAGGIAPAVPVLQYHGLADEVIPYSVEVALHDEWCSLGVTSDLVPFPGDHVATQVEAQVTVVQWISDRFAGDAPPDNC
jgi:pimeloyl-ACP methyl ester carboxylesterase